MHHETIKIIVAAKDETIAAIRESRREALEELASVARNAVGYVGRANYAERETEALQWIEEARVSLLKSTKPADSVPPEYHAGEYFKKHSKLAIVP